EENKAVTLIDSVNTKDYANSIRDSQRVVRYVSNHDVNIYEGTPMELFQGKRGALAAFVVAAYMKGVPMIYNGQEIAYTKRLEFFSSTPIDWATADEDILQEYKNLIAFYNSSDAIRRGALKSFNSKDVVVFTKELQGEKVLVI